MAKKPDAKKPDDQGDEPADTAAEPTGGEDTPDEPTEAGATDGPPDPVPVADLHQRIEKTVASLASGGDAAAVHALNKVEHLTGTLKHALPAAIATADQDLKAGLEALLALL